MPERFITNAEFDRVQAWTDENKGEFFNVSPDTWIWNIEGEPLVIIDHTDMEENRSRLILICSNDHARELEQAGIVNFSEGPQLSV